MRHRFQRLLSRFGIQIFRTSSVPFGVRWYKDLDALRNGRLVSTVFDVGANTGQTALDVTRAFPGCRVYSFEPVPATFRELVRNASGSRNIEPILCALGAAPGVAMMTAAPLSVSNRVVGQVGSGSIGESILEVPVDSVDCFCKNRDIKNINLLKIDTEGYEMDVLCGAERTLSSGKVDFVLAECEFFPRDAEPHGSFVQINQYLSDLDFRVVSFYTGGVDDLGWRWGDVLFRHMSDSRPGRVRTSPSP